MNKMIIPKKKHNKMVSYVTKTKKIKPKKKTTADV